MRQAQKLAKSDTPMFLAFVRGTADFTVQLKKKKSKTKSKAGAAHGVTEGEKRRLSKETGPVTSEESVQAVMQQKLQEADPGVRGYL